jgi:hypothetical protein
MNGRDRRLLARYAATRVVGIAALGGLTTLGVGVFGTTTAEGAGQPAADSTAVATSVTFNVNLRIALPGQYATQMRARGKTDFVHQAVETSVTLPTVGLHASLPQSAGSLLGTKPLSLKAYWVNSHAYVSVPPSLSALVGDAQVLSIPVSAADARQVATAFTQSSVALTYSHLLLGELPGLPKQRHVAAKTINGVKATGTQVDLTVAELLKLVPGLAPAMTEDAKALALVSIPVTVWVDRTGRLVEVALAATNASTGSISGTVQFSNYNSPVHVSAPAPSTVKPAPAMVQQLLGSLDLFGVTPFA